MRKGVAVIRKALYMKRVSSDVPWPSLDDASCRTREGQSIMDDYSDYPHIIPHEKNARLLCESCPARGACLEWIVAVEDPAGSWGGMIGGMSPRERRHSSHP